MLRGNQTSDSYWLLSYMRIDISINTTTLGQNVHSSLSIKQESSAESYEEEIMRREFVHQLNAQSLAFPTLEDLVAASMSEALKWKYLAQNTIYQIISAQSINTQHKSERV